MNNKGFTLVELIMVVAILALLVMIFTPNVMNLINKNNTNAYNDTIKSIENAAKMYVSDNRYSLGITCGNKTSVTIGTLIASGNLSKTPKNPCSNKKLDFNNEDIIEVAFDCNTKQFSYKFKKVEIDASGSKTYHDSYIESGTTVSYSKIEQSICTS